MRLQFPSDRGLEVSIATAAILLATIAHLLASHDLSLIGLVVGAVSLGILLGRSRA
jgi:hypothetical protein